MNPLSLAEVAASGGGRVLHPDCRFSHLSTDSRTLARGDLFVALRGPHHDGHDHITQAVARGACGLVVQRPLPLAMPQWLVSDSMRAMGRIAAMHRRQFRGTMVAITGSNGKTSVKEMLRQILAARHRVLCTDGNQNNHIGVPKTLMRLDAGHAFAVVEMGASAPGEIAAAARLARPAVALVNNVGSAHRAGFGSLEHTIEAKGEIYDVLGKSATAVINLDSPGARYFMSRSRGCRTLRFSMHDADAEVRASDCRGNGDGTRFMLHRPDGQMQVKLEVPGAHQVANALAAAACAHACGISLRDTATGLDAFAGVPGRLWVHRLGRRTLMDDSYNASPESARAAVDALVARAGPRLLVLADMAELGDEAPLWHKRLGEYARSRGVAAIYAMGQMARHAVGGDGDLLFEDRDALIKALGKHGRKYASILIKGSRASGLEAVVAAMLESGGG